jgi:hypothetical protein
MNEQCRAADLWLLSKPRAMVLFWCRVQLQNPCTAKVFLLGLSECGENLWWGIQLLSFQSCILELGENINAIVPSQRATRPGQTLIAIYLASDLLQNLTSLIVK